MKPSERTSSKWRKNSPMVHRSFAEKRGRMYKDTDSGVEPEFDFDEEMEEYQNDEDTEDY